MVLCLPRPFYQKIHKIMLFKSMKKRKQYINTVTDKIHKDFRTGTYYLKEYLDTYFTKNFNPKVVDAGCGNKGTISEYTNQCQSIIGIDTDIHALDKNVYITKKIHANLERIPLDKSSTDLIVCEFVLEHLRNPRQVLSEFARILKPDGRLLCITPQIYNPVMLLSSLLPLGIHRFFVNKLLHQKRDIHKTYYRANSLGRLKRLCKDTKLGILSYKKAGNPENTSLNKPLTWLSVLSEKIIDNKALDFLKMYLLVEIQKIPISI